MSFLTRLLLVLVAGMFILAARRAEQSCQSPGPAAPTSQGCVAPSSSPALPLVFGPTSFIHFPQRAIGPVPTIQHLWRVPYQLDEPSANL